MKRGILIVFLALVGALAAYGIYYTCATAHGRAMLRSPQGELEWLRAEFKLSDAQFEKIKVMHEEHDARCAELCRQLEARNSRAARLIAKNDSVTPEVASALEAVASAEQDCRQAMLEHIYAVSAVMSPKSGARYIESMKSHVVNSSFAHHEPMNGHLDRGS